MRSSINTSNGYTINNITISVSQGRKLETRNFRIIGQLIVMKLSHMQLRLQINFNYKFHIFSKVMQI